MTAKPSKLDNLPDLDILAFETIENIEAGPASFKEIMEEIELRKTRLLSIDISAQHIVMVLVFLMLSYA